ncbi:MAG: flagellar biosynthesis anti-sigma factor FlgM [Bacillota bacterium]|jgi:negative regulator of flagellin synthesis FlgM|nr:flagellar biosynthesis anti-sigma factor FlgM [Bacillota bacterium]
MKIYNNPNVNKIMKQYQNNVSKTNEVGKVGFKKDKLEISSGAKEFQIAMDAVKKLPDVRQDKVDEIKEKISKGKYNPSAKDVAKKMLNNANLII